MSIGVLEKKVNIFGLP